MTKNKTWLLFAGLVAVVVLVYSNHFHNEFHFDDAHTIQNNVYLKSLKNIPLFFKDGTTFSTLPSNQSYRPVLSTSLAIDYWIGNGLQDTFWFHVHSFALFLILIFMAFLFYKKIYETADKTSNYTYIALLATAFFALHPVCAETVNYIIQRGDIFAAFFTVLGFILYIYIPAARKYHLHLVVIFVGILAKPNTLVFAPFFFIYLYLFEAKLKGKDLLDFQKYPATIVKAGLAFAVCLAGYLFMSKMQSSSYVTGGSSAFKYIITQPYILFYYFTAWFAPVHLNADTDWGVFNSPNAEMILGFVFVGLLLVIAYITSNYQKTKPIAFGVLWFIIGNLPTSLLPFAEVMNDHRMFLPFVGLTLAVVWAFYLLVQAVASRIEITPIIRNTFYFIISFILLGFSYGTHQRNEVWKTEETLWKDCAEKSPKNARGLMNYGLVFMGRGDYKMAETYFLRGLNEWPRYAYLHVNMGILKNATKKYDEAESYFKSAIEHGASHPNTHYYYGNFLNGQKRKGEAINSLKKCLELSEANIAARYLLMDILFEEARLEELRQVAERTLQIIPNDAKSIAYISASAGGKSKLQIAEEMAQKANTPQGYLDLSLQYYHAGKYEESVKAAEKAVALKPDFAVAYNNIGSAYNSMGKFQEGKEALLKAIALDPTFQLAKNNLKWAEDELKKQGK